MKRVYKHTVLEEARKGVWNGYIAPSKITPCHFKDEWSLGVKLEIQYDKPSDVYYAFFSNDGKDSFLTRKLNDVLDEMHMYDCNNESGKSIRFWID